MHHPSNMSVHHLINTETLILDSHYKLIISGIHNIHKYIIIILVYNANEIKVYQKIRFLFVSMLENTSGSS